MLTIQQQQLSPAAASSLTSRSLGFAFELGGASDSLVVHLPPPWLVRLVTRTAVLVVALLSLVFFNNLPLAQAIAAAFSYNKPVESGSTDVIFLHDMAVAGLIKQGDRAAILDVGSSLLLPLLIHKYGVVVDAGGSVDIVFGDGEELDIAGVGRELKVGGVAAVRYRDGAGGKPLRFPSNFRMVYVRSFDDGAIVLAVKKTAEFVSGVGRRRSHAVLNVPRAAAAGRRLLGIPVAAKKEVLEGLEGVMLEPPASRRHRRRWRTRYLPELTGDTLEGYPRRVFVDVGAPGRAGSDGWFRQHYPMGDRDFEFIRVDVVSGDSDGDDSNGGMSEWLRKNVREEEYLVAKAEVEVVEEMVKGKTIGLVDELFLECRNQWTKDGKGRRRSRRAYWECLALYGKLRDQGVAVHQWWG